MNQMTEYVTSTLTGGVTVDVMTTIMGLLAISIILLCWSLIRDVLMRWNREDVSKSYNDWQDNKGGEFEEVYKTRYKRSSKRYSEDL